MFSEIMFKVSKLFFFVMILLLIISTVIFFYGVAFGGVINVKYAALLIIGSLASGAIAMLTVAASILTHK